MTTTRRDFVTLGTIGLLGAKQLLAQSVMPETMQAAKPILSVGWWDGLMRGDGAENPSSHILAAYAVGGGSGFRNAAAMVTTYGFWRAPVNRAIPVSLSLIAFYPEKTPFIAWNVALSSSGMTGTLRSRFIVPVDAQNRFDLAIDKHLPMKPIVMTSDLDRVKELLHDSSTLVNFGGSVGLRRGIYFIALREKDGQDLPDWSRLRVTELRSTDRVQPEGDGILLGAGGNPVDFDYIVLKIDPYGISIGRDDKAPADRRD
jgi:hypothetical protein